MLNIEYLYYILANEINFYDVLKFIGIHSVILVFEVIKMWLLIDQNLVSSKPFPDLCMHVS